MEQITPLKVWQYVTDKNVSTGTLLILWIMSSFFLFSIITAKFDLQSIRELEFSEAFKHELDAYDIFSYCANAKSSGVRFSTPSPYGALIFTCRTVSMDDELNSATYMILLWIFLCALLVWSYTTYRLAPRAYGAYCDFKGSKTSKSLL
jgi:hypothetical protein